jgi:Cu-processing system permease protein
VLTVVSYLVGHGLGDVKALVENPGPVGIEVSWSTLWVVRIAYYLFPNLSFFDLKLQAANNLPIPGSYLLWTSAYGLIYTLLMILLASIIFSRREFP